MHTDIKSYIMNCSIYNKCKKSKKKTRGPLGDYRVGNPLDRLGIDILGPLPETKNKTKYLLVIGDYFTRWMEALPLPNQKAEVVAKTLVHEFISNFGVPLEIHTDQGKNFESVLFREVCRLLEIKKTRTTPYHLASNGLVERFNRTLAKMIKGFVGDNQDNWDEHVSLLTAAYRSTAHPATGFTPNMLMLGREVNLPCDIVFPKPIQSSVELHEYVQQLRDSMEECFDLARKNLKFAAERQKRNYDRRAIENKYAPGQLVYKRNPLNKKLEVSWQGPLVIVESMGQLLYRMASKKRQSVLHHDLLRPFPEAGGGGGSS